VTLSVILLTRAGLLMRSLLLLGHVEPGVRPPSNHVVTMFVSPTGARFDNNPRALAVYWDQLLEGVRAIPGVEAASLSNSLPPDRWAFIDGYEIDNKPLPVGSAHPLVPVPAVSYDYFRTLGVPLLRGRWFDRRDTANSPGVAVISETMARRHFAGENPIGKVVRNPHGKGEVVGVVGDVKHYGLDSEPRAELFMPAWQQPLNGMALIVRTASDPKGFVASIRREVLAVDAEQPIFDVSAMVDVVSRSVFLPRVSMLLLMAFAVSALLLAVVGIYGVVSYTVTQRTRELGVRMALGADAASTLRLVLGKSMLLVAGGTVCGLIASMAMTRAMSGLLYGVSPLDPVVFLGVSLMLATAGFVASLIPARRATRVDPIVALRVQ